MALSGRAFPSPAAEYLEPVLDLQLYVVKHPSATFYARAVNDLGEGIYQNDILVIDRAVKPQSGSLVLAVIGDEFKLYRIAANSIAMQVWGVVVYVLHKA